MGSTNREGTIGELVDSLSAVPAGLDIAVPIGHHYMGHNYIGHNYIGFAAVPAGLDIVVD